MWTEVLANVLRTLSYAQRTQDTTMTTKTQTPVAQVREIFGALDTVKRVKLARGILTNVLTERERQETLFSRVWYVRTKDADSGEYVLTPCNVDNAERNYCEVYFAGYALTLENPHGLWRSSPFESVVFDVDGNALPAQTSKMTGNGNIDYKDQLRFAFMRVGQDVMRMLHVRENRPEVKPTKETLAVKDETIERQAQEIAERAEREAAKDAEIARLLALVNAQSA
jgi:hypothetical protein